RPYWRHGFATEGALACRDYAFGTLRKPRVISLVRPENAASQGVARNLGMEVIGRAPHGGYEHLVFAVSNPNIEPQHQAQHPAPSTRHGTYHPARQHQALLAQHPKHAPHPDLLSSVWRPSD